MNKKRIYIAVSLFLTSIVFGFAQPIQAQNNTLSTAEQNTIKLRQLSLFPNETLALGDFRTYVSNFYLFSIGASILIAVMLMMIGGMIWITSAGNQGRISKAKEYIINSIIGVVLLLGSYTLIQAINPRLVNLQDPNLPKIPSFGSCLVAKAPKEPKIANATHTCTLVQKADCKSPGKFDEKKPCDTLCKQYSSADGSCRLETAGSVKTDSAAVNAVNNSPIGACTWTNKQSGKEVCKEVRKLQCVENENVTNVKFNEGGTCPGSDSSTPVQDRCIGKNGSYYYGRLGWDRITPKGFLNSQELCLENVCENFDCEVNTAADAHPEIPYSLWCTCKDPA